MDAKNRVSRSSWSGMSRGQQQADKGKFKALYFLLICYFSILKNGTAVARYTDTADNISVGFSEANLRARFEWKDELDAKGSNADEVMIRETNSGVCKSRQDTPTFGPCSSFAQGHELSLSALTWRLGKNMDCNFIHGILFFYSTIVLT